MTLAGAGALLASVACTHHAPGASAAPVATSARPATDSVEIGYGAQPKDKAIGAMTTLSDKDMKTRPMRVEELLRGKVAGLEIIQNGTGVTFRIRGGTTQGGTQEPLVIVDDMMIQSGNIMNALSGLTPDDIKQVNVLKDVASTSVYGGRGAGGVIIITTKNKSPRQDDAD